jgi:hypothetical protein
MDATRRISELLCYESCHADICRQRGRCCGDDDGPGPQSHHETQARALIAAGIRNEPLSGALVGHSTNQSISSFPSHWEQYGGKI